MNTRLRESAPAFYHAMRGRLQISPPALQDLLSRHAEGGGALISSQAVACEWMHDNIDTVRSWMPLECETVLIQPDGATNCCNGEPKRLAPDLPIVCVPKCNESSQAPSVTAGRCLTLCPLGEVRRQDGQTTMCEKCPPGTNYETVPDDLLAGVTSICRPCRAGSFSSASGSMTCSVCRPGTFSSASGFTLCNICLPGHFADEVQSTACLPT